MLTDVVNDVSKNCQWGARSCFLRQRAAVSSSTGAVRRAGVRVIVDAGESVGEVGLRIKSVQLGAFDQGHGLGEGLPTCIIACEEPVLSSDSDWTHGALGRTVVDGHAAVGQELAERWPAIERVAEGPGEVAFAGYVAQLFFGPDVECLGLGRECSCRTAWRSAAALPLICASMS